MVFKKTTFRIKIGNKEKIFPVTISINQEGSFTTNLPEDITRLFQDSDIKMGLGRNPNKAFYQRSTFNELHRAISDDIKNYESVKVIERKIVLEYLIQTQCTYCMVGNEIVPNGSYEQMTTGEYNWKCGTEEMHASIRKPFGFLVYVNPIWKIVSERKDGFQIVTKERLEESDIDDNAIYLKWLDGISSIGLPRFTEVKELEYTEQTAKFFVDMIKNICLLNERIKDFLEPEKLQIVIDNKMKLLG